MPHISTKEAFESGNYALVRQIGDPVWLKRVQIDQKIIWAGVFGVFVVLLATLITLH